MKFISIQILNEYFIKICWLFADVTNGSKNFHRNIYMTSRARSQNKMKKKMYDQIAGMQ